jgi:pseudouridine-5'-phosphate glycosidase
VIAPFIERALRDAEEQNVKGNALTPFLLTRLDELTEGRSVRSNVALLKNNIGVAADIARALMLLDLPVA